MQPRQKFVAFNHQGKADAYIDALRQHGWHETLDASLARFFLSDFDGLSRREVAEYAFEKGKPFFLYPHAGRPMCQYDGMYEPYQHTTAHFVHAEGHKEIMELYGYPHPIHVAGWSYCAIREFRPTPGYRVLFAVIHPNANGWLSDVDKNVNRQTFDILLELQRFGAISLTVRYVHELEECGLDWRAGVDYEQGQKDIGDGIRSIANADLVVGHETFAFMSVALGVPTVMYGEDVTPHGGASPEAFRYAQQWDKYRHLLMFPLDILDTDDPLELLRHAADTDEHIRDWKERMIGKSFDADKFMEIVESYL